MDRKQEIKGLDQSKYTIEQIFDRKNPSNLVENLLFRFNELLFKSLERASKRVIIRTNDIGFTYFCNERKAFIFLTVCRRFLSMRFFTGDSIVRGISKGIWLNKNDNIGSKTYRIKDENTLQWALSIAHDSYDIAKEWSIQNSTKKTTIERNKLSIV